jgi:hypothetical protein
MWGTVKGIVSGKHAFTKHASRKTDFQILGFSGITFQRDDTRKTASTTLDLFIQSGTGTHASGKPCKLGPRPVAGRSLLIRILAVLTVINRLKVYDFEAAPSAESMTISARVLLTIALSWACSSAGTLNLSSVC